MERKSKKYRALVTIIAAIITISAILLACRAVYRNILRSQMNEYITAAVNLMESGDYYAAQEAAGQAGDTAIRLKDDEAAELAELYNNIISAVILADRFYYAQEYTEALLHYQTALDFISATTGISSYYIGERAAEAEGYINFYGLMQRADEISNNTADSFDNIDKLEQALSLYNDAAQAASDIPFPDGQKQAENNRALIEERIAYVKWLEEMRLEAEKYITFGNIFFNTKNYEGAIGLYNDALEIYTQIDDVEGISYAEAQISDAQIKLAEEEAAREEALQNGNADESGSGNGDAGETGTGTAEQGSGSPETGETAQMNYEHNQSIHFDLSTMIDSQNSAPANQIKMGTVDDRNEGWYNGCGWIAVYNILIKLGDPRHPADIVHYFETSGGTVLGGVFGTYPDAIEKYLSGLGFAVKHTLFPGARLSIDDAIKNAGAGILAYAHTGAAHYVMIEYSKNDGNFIVYNDSYARAYSKENGFASRALTGAVIDSPETWIDNTTEILFTFSLITASR